MIYQDFDLWMDKRQDDYYPLKAQSKMGSVTGKLSLVESSAGITDGLRRLTANRTDKDFLKEFGRILYDLVFQEKIGSLFQKSLGQVLTNQDEGLRIRLRIAPPELNRLPWEFLHDGKRFLATSTKIPLTRFIELDEPIPELSTVLPIKVLIVIPEGSGLDTDKERDDIIEELNKLNRQGEVVGYKVLDGRVTRSEIRKALREDKYHVFHFIGHGLFDGAKGFLVLNSGHGHAHDLIDAEAFGLFFQDYFSIRTFSSG
jgi:CHAT domain-containing protein